MHVIPIAGGDPTSLYRCVTHTHDLPDDTAEVSHRVTKTQKLIVQIINGQADKVRHKIIQIGVRLPPQIETLEKKGSRLCR